GLVVDCTRYHGAGSRLATSTAAASVRVNRTPWAEATMPQTALPSARPPCRNSTYMEMTRARTHPGAAVWAETFKVARMLIQPRPAAAQKKEAAGRVCARTSTHSE